jgi:hypothetical protein
MVPVSHVARAFDWMWRLHGLGIPSLIRVLLSFQGSNVGKSSPIRSTHYSGEHPGIDWIMLLDGSSVTIPKNDAQ